MLVVILIPAAIAYGLVHKNNEIEVRTVVLAVLFGSYVLSSSIFEMLQTAVSTIFISVVEDFERNDGSSGRPYHMKVHLRDLLLNDV